MSDFFNRNPFADKPASREVEKAKPKPSYTDYTLEAMKPVPQGGTDYFSLAKQMSDAMGEERRANLEAFDYMTPVSDTEYKIIRNRLLQVKDQGGDFQGEAFKIATAVEMSRYFGRSMLDTMDSFDATYSAWTGREFRPDTTHFRAIADSFTLGSLNIDMGKVARAWMDGGGQDEALEKQLDALSQQIEKYRDYAPRPWIIEALKAGAESAPFTLRAMAAGALAAGGTALALGTTGLAAPASLAILKAGASMLGSFSESADTMRGLEYYDMRKAGIDHETAQASANLSGSLQGAVESLLGNIPGIAGAGIAAKVASRLAIKGGFMAVARAAAGYIGEAIEEGLEEGIQQIISDTIQNEAKEQFGIDIKDADQIAKDAWESAKGGFTASLVMGLPSSIVGGIKTGKTAKALKEYAKTTDRDTFVERAGKWEDLKVLSEDEKKATLSKVWEQAQKKAKEQREKAGEGERKPFARTEAGTLYTEETTVGSAEEGKVEAILKVGDAESKERLGYLKYEVTDDSIIITNAPFKKGYEHLREEAVLELAAKYPDLDIKIAEGAPESIRGAVESLEGANPKGTGANWYKDQDPDTARARAKLRLAIADKMPKVSPVQREAAILLHEFRANAQGVGFADYLKKEFSSEIIGTDTSKVSAAQGQRAGILFTKDGQELRIGEFVRDAQALVMVTEKSDFVSFVHESGHLFRKQLIDTDLGKKLDEAYEIVGGQWTREHEERFVDDLVKYLSYGEAKDERLKSVFQKIAEWITRLWQKVLGQADVDPRVRAVMDELFKSEKSPLSEAARTVAIAEEGEAAEGAKALQLEGKDEVLFQNEIPYDKKEAAAILEGEKVIPEGWYVHGRNSSKKFANGSWPTQFTRDIETANSYSGEQGEVWMAKPSEGAVIADFHSEDAADMDKFIASLKNIFEGREEYGLPEDIEQVVNDIASSQGIDSEEVDFEMFEEEIRTNFTPEDIVDTAMAYDSDWINLLSYYGGTNGSWPDWVLTPDGAVLIPGSEALDSVNLTSAAREESILFQPAPPEDSEAFRKWFDGSKIVGQNGEPQVFYHQTHRDTVPKIEAEGFRTDIGRARLRDDQVPDGIFFKPEANDIRVGASVAEDTAQVPVYLSIKNPFTVSRREDIERLLGDKEYSRLANETKALDTALAKEFNQAWDTIAADPAKEAEWDAFSTDWENRAEKGLPVAAARARERLTAVLKERGYDGMIIEEDQGSFGRSTKTVIAFRSQQVKSVNNRGPWNADDPRILFQADDDKALVAVHNLSARNLEFADDIGGLAMPSLAIIRKEIPFESYGEISLIARVSMVDPKASSETKVFNADIYSPRYPSVTYKLDRKKLAPVVQKIVDALAPLYKNTKDSFYHSRVPNLWGVIADLEDKFNSQGLEGAEYYRNLRAYWRSTIKGDTRDLVELLDADFTESEREEYRTWLANTFKPFLNEPQIFKGFTNSGNRRYSPYTVENVFAEMKKAALRGGEGFTYGLPSIRALVAKQYKSLDAMRKDKDMIVSDAAFEEIKKEANAIFEEIMARADEVYEGEHYYSFPDAFQEGLEDKNLKGVLEGHGFKFTEEDYEKINLLLSTIKNMPTEYFEAKVKRIVQVAEFAGAVVPTTANAKTRAALMSKGLEIAEYDPNKPDDRAKAIQALAEKIGRESVLFQLDEDAIDAEAATFDSWQEWKQYVEGYAIPAFGEDTRAPEGIQGEIADGWYAARWESAHSRAEEEKAKAREKERKEARRGEFAASMAKPGGVEKLLAAMWDAEVQAFDVGQAIDEQEGAEIEKSYEWKKDLEQRLADHPLVLLAAQSVGNGKKLKASTRKAILTYIRHNEIEFAALYAELTGDLDLAQYAEAGRKRLHEIPDPKLERYADMSIAERTALLNRITDQGVRAKLKEGTIDDPDLLDYIRRLEESKKSLEKEAKENAEEIEKLGGKLEVEEDYARKLLVRSAVLKKDMESRDKELSKLKEQKARIETAKQAYTDALKSAKEESSLTVKIAKKTYLEALQSAQKEARLQTRLVAAEIRATEKLRQQRDALRRAILKKPGKNIIWEKRQGILTIQEYLRSKKWEYIEEIEESGKKRRRRAFDTVLGPDGKVHKVPRYTTVQIENLGAALSLLLRESPHLGKLLTNDIVDRINDKPVSAWTVAELKELKKILDTMAKEGRMAYDAKVAHEELERAEARSETNSTVRKSKYFKAPFGHGSVEQKELLKNMKKRYVLDLPFLNMRRFASVYMDGGSDGSNTRLLVDEEREHYGAKVYQIDRRLGKVFTRMQELKLGEKDFQEKVTIEGAGPGNTDYTVSVGDLMAIRLALRDRDAKGAFLYGNLFSEEERRTWNAETLQAQGLAKLQKVARAVDELAPALQEIADLIGEDFDKEFDRLNKAVIELTNQEMKKVAHYFPIHREGAYFDKFGDSILEELKSKYGMINLPDSGFTLERIKIGAAHQTPIKLDLFGTWQKAVERQEHLVSYGSYLKKLNAVYKSRKAGSVREAIIQSFGKAGMDYVDQYISEIANPHEFKGPEEGDRAVRLVRGNMAVGFLAYRWTSVVKQIITSPLPYMAYAPKGMSAAAFQCLKSGNPMQWLSEIEGMSEMLKHRTADQIFETIRNMDREGFEGVVKKIGNVGMKGLEFADRFSVAIGWKGVYDEALAKGMSHEEAVKKADDITLKTQPSARGVDLAPVFRGNNEWKRLLLQFGSALNVIYQNIRYDMPQAWREKEFGRAIAIGVSYSIAGVLLGAFTKAIGRDKSDEDEAWYRDWIYYSMTQFTDSVPLIGNELTGFMKRWIAGDKRRFGDSELLPAVEALISGADNLLEGDILKALEEIGTGLGLGIGLPTLALKEYIEFLINLLGGEGE